MHSLKYNTFELLEIYHSVLFSVSLMLFSYKWIGRIIMTLTDYTTFWACMSMEICAHSPLVFLFYLIFSQHSQLNILFCPASLNCLLLYSPLLFSTFLSSTFFYDSEHLSQLFLTRNTHCRSAAGVTFTLASQVKQDHLHFSVGHFFSLGGMWPFSCS